MKDRLAIPAISLLLLISILKPILESRRLRLESVWLEAIGRLIRLETSRLGLQTKVTLRATPPGLLRSQVGTVRVTQRIVFVRCLWRLGTSTKVARFHRRKDTGWRCVISWRWGRWGCASGQLVKGAALELLLLWLLLLRLEASLLRLEATIIESARRSEA